VSHGRLLKEEHQDATGWNCGGLDVAGAKRRL
jgi:hypothetical protein